MVASPAGPSSSGLDTIRYVSSSASRAVSFSVVRMLETRNQLTPPKISEKTPTYQATSRARIGRGRRSIGPQRLPRR